MKGASLSVPAVIKRPNIEGGKMELLKRLSEARKRSVPIVSISTSDQLALVQALRVAKNGAGRGLFAESPLLQWDSMRGWTGLNDLGVSEVGAMLSRTGAEAAALVTGNAVDSLREAFELSAGAVLICHNFQLCIDKDGVAQGVQNLRDEYKASKRMLILLSPSALNLPSELTNDIVPLDEALPSRESIETIVSDLITENELSVEPEQIRRASDALVGLSSFAAEQSIAMSLTKSGIDIAQCWERKRGVIEQTRGLTVDMGGPTFADIGGLKNAITFAQAIGPKIRCIARVDEIEKFLGGAGAQGIGDSSGVSQDALGVILREMEGNKWKGLITLGPPGSGKTLFSEAFGASLGVPTISVDLGGAKGGIVGQSEERIRALCKTVKAIGGADVYWIATCNSLDSLPGALRRRFTHGLWFFDLPSAEERDLIWKIQCRAFGVEDKNRPVDTDWTGAEIRNCASLAADTGFSLAEAAEYQVPVSVSDPESIKRLRALAAGRFISASYKGRYRIPDARGQFGRKLNMEGGE